MFDMTVWRAFGSIIVKRKEWQGLRVAMSSRAVLSFRSAEGFFAQQVNKPLAFYN